MGRTVTLRPNGMHNTGGGYWFRSADSSAISSGDYWYLQDNNDGTYLYGIMSNVDTFGLEFGSYTLAGDEKCSEARLVQRIAGTSPSFPMAVESWIGVGAGNMGYGDGGGATYNGTYGRWSQVWNPGYNADFSQAAIDNLRAYYRKLDQTTTPSVSEVYLDLWVQTRSTVTITGPAAGAVVMAQQPNVTWSYDNKGDTVRAHQVKVFTEAVRLGAGFDPNSSATVWDSGRVNGAATEKTIGVALTYGQTYYVYVRQATNFLDTDWWSNWSNTYFRINTPPTVTNVTVTPTPVSGEITTTNTPTIGWTYADTDNDAQLAWYVRVFPESVYSAAGFNNGSDTGASWVGSGTSTTTRNVTTGALSPNVNYRAYVWVSDQGINGRWTGPTLSATFLIRTATGLLFDPPTAPAVGPITTDQEQQRVVVTVEGRGNMLTRNQSTIDTGVVGWENLSNGTLGRSTTVSLRGGSSLTQTAQAIGDMTARSGPGGTKAFPVTPGRQYIALGAARPASAVRPFRLDIRWYNAAGTVLSTSQGAEATELVAQWLGHSVTAVAPANAATADVLLVVRDVQTVGEVHYWDDLSFAPGNAGIWHRGGFVYEQGALEDNFDRANSATSLGTAQVGGAWAAQAGTWGVQDNRAYAATMANGTHGMAVLTSSYLADGFVEADITLSTVRACAGLVFRNQDANNTLMARLLKYGTTDAIDIYKRVGGTFTLLAQVTAAGLVLGTTYRLRVEFYGGQVYVYVDGQLRITHLLLAGELTTFGAYSKYGLYLLPDASPNTDDLGSRFNNFKAGAPATQTVTLERTLDGTNWYAVRGAVDLALGASQQVVLYDYEVPAGQLATYRATASAEEAGTTFTSPPSTSLAQASALVVDSWWLKDPQAPELNMVIQVQPGFSFRRKEPLEVFEPLGRKQSVFVSDGPKGVEGDLTIWSKDRDTYDALDAILRTGRPLILQSPLGHSWWVKFGDHDWELLRAQRTEDDPAGAGIRHFHQLSLSFHEVAAPAVV